MLNIARIEKLMSLKPSVLVLSIFVSFFISGLAVTANSATLNSALDRYNVGDYRGAIEQWEHLARMGNPDALFNLGQVYRLGNGVDLDAAKVEYFYRRAAEAGHIEAQNNLATLYYFDSFNTSRRGEALTWWRLAARHGHGASQYMLAVLHYNGEFLPKDNIQAFAWVVLAREAGVEEAIVAERAMRRTLTVNEMTQGRMLSRGLIDAAPQAPDLNITIPNPIEDSIDQQSFSELPLVADAPTEPSSPTAPSVPSTPTEPSSPSAPPTPLVANETLQATADPHGLMQGWRLQMGSFRSAASANGLFTAIQQQHPLLVEGLEGQVAEADLGDRGVFYRLVIGVFVDRDAAVAHCQSLKDVGYVCIPKAP